MKERVRGVIFRGEGPAATIILMKRVKPHQGVYYVFPGGGVEPGEDREAALMREIKEEIGVTVTVLHMVMALPFHSERGDEMEFFYSCNMIDGVIGSGDGPEFQEGNSYEGTHEAVEVPVGEIRELNLLPLKVKDFVIKDFNL